jgi:hypothetical protein
VQLASSVEPAECAPTPEASEVPDVSSSVVDSSRIASVDCRMLICILADRRRLPGSSIGTSSPLQPGAWLGSPVHNQAAACAWMHETLQCSLLIVFLSDVQRFWASLQSTFRADAFLMMTHAYAHRRRSMSCSHLAVRTAKMLVKRSHTDH